MDARASPLSCAAWSAIGAMAMVASTAIAVLYCHFLKVFTSELPECCALPRNLYSSLKSVHLQIVRALWPVQRTPQPPLQDLVFRIELQCLTYPFRIRLIGKFRNQTNNFALADLYSVPGGDLAYSGM
jgi:hypothetical protein